MSQMVPKPLFTCNFCKKTFTRKLTLDNHIDSYHEKKGYVCEICKVRISRKRPHSCAVEHGVCECYVCGLRFSSSKAMFRHRNLAHPVEMSITEVELAQNSVKMQSDNERKSSPIPFASIDSVLKQTLFLGGQNETVVVEFENHRALRHFQLTENTVVSCDGIIFLKCPLCLEAYDTLDSFKQHIDSYRFLPSNQKNDFLDAVSEIFADMTTFYFNPAINELSS